MRQYIILYETVLNLNKKYPWTSQTSLGKNDATRNQLWDKKCKLCD